MRKDTLLRLSVVCFVIGFALLFFIGCSETEILTTLEETTHPGEEEPGGEVFASVESWEYDPCGSYISLVIWVTNGSGQYVSYYEVYYRVDFGEGYKRDFICGFRLREGYSRKEYAHLKIGMNREVSKVVVDDIMFKSY